ncbi:tyrosine-type recombinase/integrase [Mesorhizobium sp. M2A.F.Ca.ET.039.01.1.1]|uniref:tyrosine-type recombinase/integrase n=1 Tax=Mesorhizobium sp. M2A.F.Ca.ET.039.01.1.1 TaxID=2496746 RepID=UPI000FCAC53A|nr:tyrosine-type recombinase/integrase [Mesorhizobium sp. M2A.F.Ca.ET.039.01.1.1]RWX72505.1 integrase [Mesorhizobium sp. M2A.F.Ca.ET.039.01.1.1]
MMFRLKNVCRETDRHKKVRYYYRAGKGPRIALTGEPGSDEFKASYDAACGGIRRPASAERQAIKVAIPRTLRWLCQNYFAAPEFTGLDASTQRVRRQIVEHCLDEPTEPGATTTFADFPLDRLTPKAIRVLRDRKADFPEAANNRVKAIRQVLKYGVDTDELPTNVAREVPYLKGKPGGFHAWTIEEVEQFEAKYPIGTQARLAFALLLYTAQRRSDIVRFGQQHVRDGWLHFTQQKGRSKNPVTLSIPIVKPLRDIIAATPTGIKTFLVTEFGKPFADAGFGNKFRYWCNKAGLPHCSAHGLRKATSARLAELGCSDREIMAITGHQTMKEVTRYTKSARQRVLAASAMQKFEAANEPANP